MGCGHWGIWVYTLIEIHICSVNERNWLELQNMQIKKEGSKTEKREKKCDVISEEETCTLLSCDKTVIIGCPLSKDT